jgi:hypothetical protein
MMRKWQADRLEKDEDTSGVPEMTPASIKGGSFSPPVLPCRLTRRSQRPVFATMATRARS